MEDFLLFLIFIILLYIVSNLKSRFNHIDNSIDDLNRKLNLLKPTEKVAVTPTLPILEKEKITPIPQEIKPPVVVPIIKETTPEKVVYATETINVPKPEQPKPIQKPYIPIAPKKSFWENFKEKNPDLEKFIGENLISKLGILILVLGISYFVKYAIDKNWINEPARVGIGVLSGALVMGIAHKLRQQYAAFSSVFVAGAIAVFYFTIGIAFHEYHLFNQTIAFIIMVAITAFSVLISYSYNRIELAVLSLIGGFAVPFMISTGSGNYVVLFTYIIILNIGILALAYHKKWNLVNALAFIFTITLYGGWLVTEINLPKPHYLGALLFGFAFYFIFILINILNNMRTKSVFSKMQLALLAANTFLFYGAGMAILSAYHPELKGLFTIIIAFLNLIYAWFLYKKFGLDKTAVYLLIGLTLTFVTLAIPIQFNGHYITLFWAAEAVLLMWLSQKSKIVSYRFGSIIVHFLMLISLIMDWQKIYGGDAILSIIISPIFITGIFAITSLFAVYYLIRNETKSFKLLGFTFNPSNYSKYCYAVGIVISYFVGIIEVGYQSDSYVKNVHSATTLPIVYHLLFCAVLTYFLIKSKTKFGSTLATIIAIANIVLFVFVFSHFAFSENEDYINTGIQQRTAFYLHYISLAITIYFGIQLYKMYSEKTLSTFFNKKIFLWIATFFVIYIASTEVMLHGLVLTDSQISTQEIAKYIKDNNVLNSETAYVRQDLAYNKIEALRETITKTSFPVLWGILAFAFLIFGIKKPSKTIRIIALSLLGLTIVKLFLYDISNVSETGKIIAFILLGVLILIISFVYQKIKVLVIDDKTPELTTNIDKNE